MLTLDLSVAQFFQSLINRFFILDLSGIILARYFPFLIVILAISFLWKQSSLKKRIFALSFWVLSLVLSRGLIFEFIQYFYKKPRPFKYLEFEPLIFNGAPAFPSGHATFFFTLAFAIFVFNKKWGWWFTGFAALNGAARMFTGIHWLTDIVGGAVVAAVGVSLAYLILQRPLQVLYKDKGEIE